MAPFIGILEQKLNQKDSLIKDIYMVYGLIHSENFCLEKDLLESSLKQGHIKLLTYAESRNPNKPKTYV